MINNKSMNIWMQMLGFEMNDPDRGVKRYLDNLGFTPESICALLFHPDFVNLHRGMDEEYTLFKDNCAYYGIPRNNERERQEWTNYKLRELIANLKKNGVDFYAGIMGICLDNAFHHEFVSDHPELRFTERDGNSYHILVLKRFKDGTYYEDFFVEKLVQALKDYDCAGVHFADGFCPSNRLYQADYTTDMVDQFLTHTGLALPPNVNATMGDDSKDALEARAEYIWANLRADWVKFYEWRWEGFYKKICDAVHKIGKKVWSLGILCTDPFETSYIWGLSVKKMMEAGVDCLTANILPTGCHLLNPNCEYFFHRVHLDLPFLRSWVGDHKVISMLGIQDASEEWSCIQHRPIHIERDIFTMNAMRGKGDGTEAAAEGLLFCLGDGIPSTDWNFLTKRIDIGTSLDVEKCWSPMVFWSNDAHEKMLDEYISTRRTTPHYQATKVFKQGVPFGGCLTIDQLGKRNEPMFVPNFDMLSEPEKAYFMNAKEPWVATVPMNYNIEGINYTFEFTDNFSDYPIKAFIVNAELTDEEKAEIEKLNSVDDGIRSEGDDPECDIYSLYRYLLFRKLNSGFINGVCVLLKAAMYKNFPIKSEVPLLAFKLKNGKDRLYIYNTNDNHYLYAVLKSADNIDTAEMVSTFPILPPRFLDAKDTSLFYNHEEEKKEKKLFQIKLAPAGLAILDIKR